MDWELLRTVYDNLVSWVYSRLRSPLPSETTNLDGRHRAVFVDRPGGAEVLAVRALGSADDAAPTPFATSGYNLRPLLSPTSDPDLPPDAVLLRVSHFSVNYADVCVRWGLYESARKFVGWPIVPGFDVAGVVEATGSEVRGLAKGDAAFGVTLFGGYSTRVHAPAAQLRRNVSSWDAARCAALPAVSLTALYALRMGGAWPRDARRGRNASILIHSAAGGVGSMLVQMSRLLGLSPVVGVVGRPEKVAEAREMGCDAVIDKSNMTSEELWAAAREAAPADGYALVMDANGVDTLKQSYDALAPTGRLVVFGFHTNLPRGAGMLSPLEWLRMGRKMAKMPAFDPMDLTVSNKSVMGFNLSFMSEETEVVSELFDCVVKWAEEGEIRPPAVTKMEMDQVGAAHELIQSGKSVGKIVIQTGF
mmetsp:Transcript_38448/g.89386  ORF Transcript_38448/g.89386 Transcript_38448/m.89386 type:complete len:420 (-) Transcript_38448:38-1297(-)